ncbi:MAG: glycosyltransferase family 2 protein [Candidatus Binataceae bacterium]|nr:glycosyltransferase family 2 protein [Candidatus Binataceae bacterium]
MDNQKSSKLLSVVILTHNEEPNLAVCLSSLEGLSAEIFVVDSGSVDRTAEIARGFGARVVEHPFVNYAAQLNWALDNLPIRTPWVMRLDADERLTPELAAELQSALPEAPADVSAFMMKRRVYFWGRWIRHGGYYPTWLLRVWRHRQARCEERWMDEHMIVLAGQTLRLGNDFIDENRKGLGFWTGKHNRYADREVADLTASGLLSSAPGLPDQMGRRRWFKQNFYGRLPLFWRAFFYWFFRYFILLGFLDGKPGLVFHFLQGFWYRFLVDAKLYESGLPRNATGGAGVHMAENGWDHAEAGRREVGSADN